MTRQVALSGAILLLTMSSLLADDSVNSGQPRATAGHSERPAWCGKGFVCIPTQDAADLTVKLADLEAEIAALKAARKSGFGFCFGPSLSVGAMPVASGSGWDWKATAGPGVSVTWGWRPR